MATTLHPATKLESFTEGLLLDMGVLLLFMKKKEEYVDVYSTWQRESVSLSELERDMFGFDHAEVGAIVANMWQLPGSLVTAIENHHHSDESHEVKPAIKLVSMLKDNPMDDGKDALLDTATGLYHIDKKAIVSMIDTAYEEAFKFQAMLHS